MGNLQGSGQNGQLSQRLEVASKTGRLALSGKDVVFNKIPTDLFLLSSLKVLDLSNCNLTGSLNEKICSSLRKLEVLKLNNNPKLVSIPFAIALLDELKRLEISNTGISELEVLPKQLKQIEAINCNFSGLLEHPQFALTSSIQSINLCNNVKLTGFGKGLGFEMYSNLEEILLTDCENFTEIPKEIGKLKRLQVLRLENTNVQNLPVELFKDTLLSRLELKGCKGFTKEKLLKCDGIDSFLERRLNRLNRDIAAGVETDRSVCGLD